MYSLSHTITIFILIAIFIVFLMWLKKLILRSKLVKRPVVVAVILFAIFFISTPVVLVIDNFFLYNSGIVVIDNKISHYALNKSMFLTHHNDKLLLKTEDKKDYSIYKTDTVKTLTKDEYFISETFNINIKIKEKPTDKEKVFTVQHSYKLKEKNLRYPTMERYKDDLVKYLVITLKQEIKEKEKEFLNNDYYKYISEDLSKNLTDKGIFIIEITHIET